MPPPSLCLPALTPTPCHPPPADHSWLRAHASWLALSLPFHVLVGINFVALVGCAFVDLPALSHLLTVSDVCVALFALEALLKLYAQRRRYFQDPRNRLCLALLVLAAVRLILRAGTASSGLGGSPLVFANALWTLRAGHLRSALTSCGHARVAPRGRGVLRHSQGGA